MNIYGGLDFGIASPIAYSGSSIAGEKSSNKAVDTSPSTGMAGIATAHYEPAVSDAGKASSSDKWNTGYNQEETTPAKVPDTTNNVDPVPEPAEKHLDVDKLLGYQNEGYKLYSDGEGGLTLDPYTKDKVYDPSSVQNSKGQTAHDAEKRAARNATLPEVSSIYNTDGDDYSIDNTAFANAQMGTGDNQAAASIAGSSGGGHKANSNVNDAIFGGESNKATPGYSLW